MLTRMHTTAHPHPYREDTFVYNSITSCMNIYIYREETFVTESDAAAADYKDPSTGKPLQKMTEESYFFRSVYVCMRMCM